MPESGAAPASAAAGTQRSLDGDVRPAGPARPELSAARLEELVEALASTETEDALAADALRRAQQLEAERAARQRSERLQSMMRALVASASMADVQAAVFQHGLLPFGATAARLILTDRQQPSRVQTVSAVGMPEPA